MKLLSLKHFILLILIFVNSVGVLAQCPDVINANQSFCDLEAPTIASLQAVDNGGGVAWYASPTSTIALSPGTLLLNGDVYYADDSSGQCGLRAQVSVTIYTMPNAPSFQGVCVNDTTEATIADLSANGNAIKWYLTPSGGVPLSSDTQLVNNMMYYASQANPHTGCETSRRPVFVSIIILTAPVGAHDQWFCLDPQQTAPTLADIVLSGSVHNWYSSENSVLHLPLSTPLVDGYTYYASSVAGPCESQNRLAVTVHLEGPNDAGSSDSLDICQTDIVLLPILNLFDYLGGTPQQTGSWAGALPITNGYLGTIDLNLLVPNTLYTFTYTVNNYSSCPIEEATVSINIIPSEYIGQNGTLKLCSTDVQLYDLFDYLGEPLDAGGTWSPVLSGGNGIFNPALDSFGVYTYSYNDGCTTYTASVNVSEIPTLDAGTNGSLELCSTDTQTYDLFDLLGGTPDLGGIWSPTLASGGSIFNPALDTLGVYTYSFNDTCSTSSATITITEIPTLDAGTNGSLELCADDVQTYDLFYLLGGTPDLGGIWTPTLASGGSIFNPALDTFGIYTYSFNDTCNTSSATITITEIPTLDAGTDGNLELCSTDTQTYDLFDLLGGTPDLGGIWSPTLASGGSIFNPALDTFGIYTYSFNDTCSTSSATITITEIPTLDAGTDGSLELCSTDTQTYDLFDLLGGTPDLGGIWSPTLASGGSIFNPALDTLGVYTYSFNDTCSTSSATITITEIPTPDAGTNGSLELCSTDTQTYDLFDFLGGTPDVGGSWSPTLASGGSIFNPALDTLGVYTYSFNDTCSTSSATITITEIPTLDAGTDGSLELCSTDTQTYDLFDSLGGTPDVGGSWSPALAGGGSVFNPALDALGVYTYSFADGCNTSSATVTISEAPTLDAGTNGSLTLCANDTQTYDLFDSLGGTPDVGGSWSPALAGGGSVFNPALDALGVYTYSFNDPCNGSSTVTISEIPTLDAGINGSLTLCANDTQTYDLFDLLGGTPDLGGIWSPTLASGGSIFNPALDTLGVYTYSFNDTCSTSSATITITEIPTLDAGTDGSLELCSTDPQTYDLFDLLGGTPDLGGIWSPALASGGSIFNPALDTFGIYTYSFNDTCNTSSATITITEIPTLDAGTDGSLELCSTDPQTYDLFDLLGGTPDLGGIWLPTLASGGSIFNPALDTLGVYTYSFNDTCNSSFATVTIISVDCMDDVLLIPDGFSPNGDGINDFFEIKDIRTLFPNFRIEIYNRYGNILFKGNKDTPDWDGTSQQGLRIDGGKAPIGVYFFILELNDGKKSPIQGRLYLSR